MSRGPGADARGDEDHGCENGVNLRTMLLVRRRWARSSTSAHRRLLSRRKPHCSMLRQLAGEGPAASDGASTTSGGVHLFSKITCNRGASHGAPSGGGSFKEHPKACPQEFRQQKSKPSARSKTQENYRRICLQ
eukprot:1455928-Pyramimonas_sp.AAC.1